MWGGWVGRRFFIPEAAGIAWRWWAFRRRTFLLGWLSFMEKATTPNPSDGVTREQKEWDVEERKPTLLCLEPSPRGPSVSQGYPGPESMGVHREACLEPTHIKAEATGANSCKGVQSRSSKSQICLHRGKFCCYSEGFTSLDGGPPTPMKSLYVLKVC